MQNLKKYMGIVRDSLSFPDEAMNEKFLTTMDARSLEIVSTTLFFVAPAFVVVLLIIYYLNPNDPLLIQFGIPGLACSLMWLLYTILKNQNIIYFDLLAFTSQSSMFFASRSDVGYPLYLLLFPLQQMMLVLIQPQRFFKHMISFVFYVFLCSLSLTNLDCDHPAMSVLCSFRDRSHYLMVVIGNCIMVSAFTSEMLARHLFQHRQKEMLQKRTEQILSYLSHNLRNPLMVAKEQFSVLTQTGSFPKTDQPTITEISKTLKTFQHVLDNCLEFQQVSKWEAWEEGGSRKAKQIVSENISGSDDEAEAVTSVDYFFSNESSAFRFEESDGGQSSVGIEELQKPPKLTKIQRVLHADDNQLILKVMERMISTFDPNIIYKSAINGKLAVNEYLANPPGFFDLVLMDIVMPVMDGHEASRQLRKLGYKGLIIALTANASEMQGKYCLASGINLVLHKPIENQRLKNLFMELVKTDGDLSKKNF